MEPGFIGDGLDPRREREERAPVSRRLRRIEGQVPGPRQRPEEDRDCPDDGPRANATSAAVRAVALTIMAPHRTAGLEVAIEARDVPAGRHVARLGAAMRQ